MNLGKFLEDASDVDGQLSGVQTGLSAELFHIVNEEYKIEVDRTFERLRSAELQGKLYEQDDYRRIAFRNEEQAAAFQNYMQEHNINAVMPSVRINGQYLVEIPRIVKIKEIQDKTGNVSSDDNLFQIKDTRESQGAEFLTDKDMLAAYYGDTGEELDDDKHTQTYTDKHYDNNEDYNKVREVSAEINGSLMSHLDGISEVYNIIRRISGTIEKYKLYDEEKREEKNLFETKEHSEKERGWDEVYSPRTRSGNKETAVVLNNNIVMINGQVVTDKTVCDNILKRHHERMAKANAISSTAVHAPTTISAIGSAIGTAVAGDEYRKAIHREENNANIIQAQVYQQEYTVYTRTKTEGMLFHGGVMNEITEQANAGNVISHIHSDYHLKKEDTADTFNRMNEMLKDDEKRFSSVQRNLLEKINNGLHDGDSDTLTISLSIDDRENIKHMLHTASARVYVVRGSENNAIAHLQTVMAGAGVTEALSQLSETERQNVVESLKRFAKTKDENLSDIANTLDSMERTVIMKLDVNPNAQLSASEEKALQSALTKQSAESTANKAFRKKADEIGKLMKFDEQETLLMQAAGTEAVLQKIIDYEKARNVNNPDYEPMKIGEMSSGNLKKYTAEDVERMGISEKDWNAANAFMQNKDKMMANLSTLKALEKDFGIKISDDEPLTRERLLKVNEAFLKRASEKGYQFVKPDGTFDVEALKALDKDQLKELGISNETRNMLVKVNTDSEWGFDIKKFGSDSFHIFTSVLNTLTKGDEEMAKTRQDFKLMKKTTKYTKKSAASVYRAGKAVKMRVSTFRLRHHSNTGVGSAAAGTKADAFEKAVNSARERAVNLEANDKYARKMERKLERVKRDENSILNKSSRWVQDQKERVQRGAISLARRTGTRISARLSTNRVGRAILSVANRIGNVAKGAMALAKSATVTVEAVKAVAAKYIAIAAAFFLLLCIHQLAFMMIMMSIASMTEPQYTDKTAFVLYETLKKQEDKWVKELGDNDYNFNTRDKGNYGSMNKNYAGYVEEIDRLMLGFNDDGTENNNLYINPFECADNNVSAVNWNLNRELLTRIEKYDGKTTTGFSTNINNFNRRKEEENFDSGFSSIENGHTCNIKDILSMIDVMYQFNTGSMSDAALTDIMGVKPSTINWADTANNVATWFKWAKAKVTSWFSETDDPFADMKWSEAKASNGTVSFKAIENYAVSLWETSHQEEMYYEVNFHDVLRDADGKPTNKYTVLSNGSAKEVTLNQNQASDLNLCIEPVKKSLPLFWNDNNPQPYINGKDADGNDVKFSTVGSHADDAGFSIHVDMTNLADGEKPCLWSGMNETEETWNAVQKMEDEKLNDCWSSEYNTERIIENFRSDSQVDDEPYSLEACNWNAVQKAEKYLEDFFKENPTTITISDDKNTITKVWYEKATDCNRTYTCTLLIDGGLVNLGEDGIEEDGEWSNVTAKRSDGYCHVNAIIIKHTKTFTRNCKGHNFEFCGGHVRLHNQGVIFSATNEQMAMTGIADPSPVAVKVPSESGSLVDYKLENNGYDTLRGKYINIKYEGADEAEIFHNMIAGIGNETLPVAKDIQGSKVTAGKGVNLWSEDGVQWYVASEKNGIKADDIGNKSWIRDIFDADCLLLKAKGIFPIRDVKDYKGWDTDNMQTALMKLSTDWTDMYGFNVPLEIGDKWDKNQADRTEEGISTAGYTLNSEDISIIMKLIEAQYPNLSENRKNAVELTLKWVGKGHYSEVHKAHDFLSVTCNGTITVNRATEVESEGEDGEEVDYHKMKGCCTASDNIGFINYIYKQSGLTDFNYRSEDETTFISNADANYVIPVDLLVRKNGYAVKDFDIGSANWKNNGTEGENTREVMNRYSKPEAVIFIGKFNYDAFETLKSKGYEVIEKDYTKYITLSGGQKIYANVPVTVDLSEIHNIGSIYLHTLEPEDVMDLNGDTAYWWTMDGASPYSGNYIKYNVYGYHNDELDNVVVTDETYDET